MLRDNMRRKELPCRIVDFPVDFDFAAFSCSGGATTGPGGLNPPD